MQTSVIGQVCVPQKSQKSWDSSGEMCKNLRRKQAEAQENGCRERKSLRYLGVPNLPTYERGDYVKVEFPDEATGIGEWMWVRVTRCDEEKQFVFGVLDNEPLNDYE